MDGQRHHSPHTLSSVSETEVMSGHSIDRGVGINTAGFYSYNFLLISDFDGLFLSFFFVYFDQILDHNNTEKRIVIEG